MSGFNHPAETWNKRFSGADYIFGTQANTWLTRQASHMPKSGRVLAVADGEGRNSIRLAQQGYQVDALDRDFQVVSGSVGTNPIIKIVHD